MKKQNLLINETSPYLLQHAENPVNWYPWCDQAFEKAKAEDKPIFLSIGYSTCHWCHVMAHESFEDEATAAILNQHFVSIKVDKEERPDIDAVYMEVCQALTGSGGWPTSLFITPEQKPFFAGTYFPNQPSYSMISFKELLQNIIAAWQNKRPELEATGDKIIAAIAKSETASVQATMALADTAVEGFKRTFDMLNGGFGDAPKFPSPHNLLLLLSYYEATGDKETLAMAEKTLEQMYRGGLFDHFGFGFSRYSTDRHWLAPHFEKMLYDNALLLSAYTKAYEITKKPMYQEVVAKTAQYVLREMQNPNGGFYAAQDADSEGVEGKFYIFAYDEIIKLLGQEAGAKLAAYFDISPQGNFEGQNIPNLLKTPNLDPSFDQYLPQLYEYRQKRMKLHLDDKTLTAWNGLLIGALAQMYHSFNQPEYLVAAKKTCLFIDQNLSDGDSLKVSFRQGKASGEGFLQDYACYIYGLLAMYQACHDDNYLGRAGALTTKAINEFYDQENGGFYLYGSHHHQLIAKPKETYDGALPSGNSLMAYNLIALSAYSHNQQLNTIRDQHLAYMGGFVQNYPMGYSFYLWSLVDFLKKD